MKSQRRPHLGALLALSWIAAAACSTAPEPPAGAKSDASEPVVDVQIATARRAPISRRISAPGTLEARRESHIGTEVQGRILRVRVDEGDRVEAGAPLFDIDPEPYQMALRQAEARRDLAGAERVQGEADLARARSLETRGVVAQQQIEKLETALTVARANERQATEAVALARFELDRTSVRAPWAGSVVARLADEGSTALVQPQTIVVVLQESNELEARAPIPESQLALVQIGDAAELHVEGISGPIRTNVTAVGDAIDPATRTYTVKMRVPNADHALKAGVFALVEILPRAKPDAIVVPRDAIRSEDGRTRVLTVRDGRATSVVVTLGIVSGDEAEILEGVAPDTPVIVGEGARELASGMRVRVVPAPGDAS